VEKIKTKGEHKQENQADLQHNAYEEYAKELAATDTIQDHVVVVPVGINDSDKTEESEESGSNDKANEDTETDEDTESEKE